MLGKVVFFLVVLAALGLGVGLAALKSHNFRGTLHEPWLPALQADLSGSQLVGKTVVLTGGNTGIGKEMVTALLSMGADVIVGCRSIERCQRAYDSEIGVRAVELAMRRRSSKQVGAFSALPLDLGSLASVRAFVELLGGRPIDVLIDNAAVAGENGGRTVDGLGEVMGTNHFGVYLLTRLLLPNLLRAKAPARVVVVASDAHQYAPLYDLDDLSCSGERWQGSVGGFQTYALSKLSNIFMARELAARLRATPITVNSVHPGFIKTDLARELKDGVVKALFDWLSMAVAMNAWDGAQNTVYLAASPDVATVSGEYYARFAPAPTKLGPYSDMIQQILWRRSAEIVGLPVDLDL